MRRSNVQKLLPLMLTTCMAAPAFGASHREAPLIALDPAQITPTRMRSEVGRIRTKSCLF